MIAPWTRISGGLSYYREVRRMPRRFPLWCDLMQSSLVPLTSKLQDDRVVRELPESPGVFSDHMEISGRTISALLSYGCDEQGHLRLHRHLVFPSIRVHPRATRGHLAYNFDALWYGDLRFNGKEDDEQLIRIEQCGHLQLLSRTSKADIVRTYHVAVDHPYLLETITITNTSRARLSLSYFDRSLTIQTRANKRRTTSHYLFIIPSHRTLSTTLAPKASVELSYVYTASSQAERPHVEREEAIANRKAWIQQTLHQGMQLKTPNPVLNTLFSYAKLRGLESCFDTTQGPLHSPGGGEYYAAIWTNDQAEYSYPLFPWFGDDATTEAALRGYRLFAHQFQQGRAILPSSLVDGGTTPFSVAGDRGDNAMFASGLLRFLLSARNLEWLHELWSAAEQALTHLWNRQDSKGLIRSNSDELEGRFPSGRANLATQCLTYDALQSAAMIQTMLRHEAQATTYKERAELLKTSILTHLRGDVQGYDTYRYYGRNRVLRSWICLPMTVGIQEAAESTIQALFSEHLWIQAGLKTATNKSITWDRSLLFALRAAFQSNQPEVAYEKLVAYSQSRLLGTHTPYPVEAYPEGNGAHLAAESLLYLRIFIDGLFGLRPLDFERYECKPTLPRALPYAALEAIVLFGQPFTLRLDKENGLLRFQIERAGQSCYQHVGPMGERFEVTSADLGITAIDIPEEPLPIVEEPPQEPLSPLQNDPEHSTEPTPEEVPIVASKKPRRKKESSYDASLLEKERSPEPPSSDSMETVEETPVISQQSLPPKRRKKREVVSTPSPDQSLVDPSSTEVPTAEAMPEATPAATPAEVPSLEESLIPPETPETKD